MTTASEKDIIGWSIQSLENENLEKCEVNINGTSEKTDGYVGKIVFTTVTGTTKKNTKKTFNLVLKYSKSETQGKNFINMIKLLFEREIRFYTSILPTLQTFQLKNNVIEIFNAVPKCYNTILEEDMQAIVMEDMKKQGYILHNRKNTLNLNHLKLALKEYGRFHAISLALKNKKHKDFEKLVEDFQDLGMMFYQQDTFVNHVKKRGEVVCGILRERKEWKLLDAYTPINKKGFDVVLSEILNTSEQQSFILHGDCWNNNYLFKYNDDPNSPTNMVILDWQAARLHSPVIDLSYLIYNTCGQHELEHFDELIKYYYTNFSNTLRELNCSPEELFPFSSLLEHWKKYSLFGLTIAIAFLHVTICDKEDAPDLDNYNREESRNPFDIEIKDPENYSKRLIAVLKHCLTFSL